MFHSVPLSQTRRMPLPTPWRRGQAPGGFSKAQQPEFWVIGTAFVQTRELLRQAARLNPVAQIEPAYVCLYVRLHPDGGVVYDDEAAPQRSGVVGQAPYFDLAGHATRKFEQRMGNFGDALRVLYENSRGGMSASAYEFRNCDQARFMRNEALFSVECSHEAFLGLPQLIVGSDGSGA